MKLLKYLPKQFLKIMYAHLCRRHCLIAALLTVLQGLFFILYLTVNTIEPSSVALSVIVRKTDSFASLFVSFLKLLRNGTTYWLLSENSE